MKKIINIKKNWEFFSVRQFKFRDNENPVDRAIIFTHTCYLTIKVNKILFERNTLY